MSAKLNHVTGRNTEIVGRRHHVAVKRDEQLGRYGIPEIALAGGERLAAYEEGNFGQLEPEFLNAELRQHTENFWLLEEAVAQFHNVEIAIQMRDLDPLFIRHRRLRHELHLHQQNPLVQNAIMLQIMQQCVGHNVGMRHHKNRRTGHPDGWSRQYISQENIQRNRIPPAGFQKPVSAVDPNRHNKEQERCKAEREPAAVKEFQQIGAKKDNVDDEKNTEQGDDVIKRPIVLLHHHNARQHRNYRHRPRHRNAVSRTQIIRSLEHHDQSLNDQEQNDIDLTDINLADFFSRCMAHPNSRNIAKLHGLVGNRKRP